MDHGMLITPDEADHLTIHHPHIKKIKTALDRSATKPLDDKKQKYIRETLRNCMRLMKFVSPNNEIGDFSWACMANADKINQFFVILKTTLEMKGRTIANYYKALYKVLMTATDDNDFKLTQKDTHSHVESLMRTYRQARKNNTKEISREKVNRPVLHAYTDIKETELDYINIYKNLEKVRSVATPLIKRAKRGRVSLTDSELFIVNGFF